MAEIDGPLLQRAEAWLKDDPDPATRAELSELLARGDGDGIRERFTGTLQFGTAGLRGILGAGPNRMNRAVVVRATAGLCAWLKLEVSEAAERGVCIGFDGRRMSRELAREAAEVVVGAGLRAHVFEEVVPTPLLAFSVLDRNACAGVMVTASHNPPQYNGYKVYWGNGAQIIPPHDDGIAGCIAAVPSVMRVPKVEYAQARGDGRLVVLGQDVTKRYLDGVTRLTIHPEVPKAELVIAYTALHGVGEPLFRAALAAAGFLRVHTVAEQAEPDGAFPTVAFPNPEEKGAMDLVLALAARERADVVLANDPDADRLAVAVRDEDGTYVTLNGNEIGCLLGHYLLSEGRGADRLVLSSVVSSPMLGAIAEAHDAHFEQTLTGFKWIANRAMELERHRGLSFVFGYEEALGYTVGTHVRDKDGISAALTMAEMAAWCRSSGRSLLDERERMWRRYGLFLSRQVSVMMPGAEGASAIAGVMERVRSSPPTEVASHAVTAFSDLLRATRYPAGGVVEKLHYPPSDVLMLELEGGHRVMLRPSGTEPKIKFYFDVRIALRQGEAVEDGQARGQALLGVLVEGLRAITGVA